MASREASFARLRAATRSRDRIVGLATVLVAIAIAAAGCGGGSSPPEGVRATPATRLFFRYSQGPAPTLASPKSDTQRYEIVILAGAYWKLAARLKAADPNVRVLLYKAVTETIETKNVLSDRSRTTVVDYAEALAKHPGWLLRNATGDLITRPYGNDTDALVDVGSPAVQQQSYEGMLRQAKADGWDGIFLDDVLPTLRFWLPSGHPQDVLRYPTDARWGAATRSFLASVGPRLRAQGLLVVANTCCSLTYRQRGDWASLLDGTMDEGFLSPATDRTTPLSTTSPTVWNDWRGYLAEVVAAEASGKIFLAHTPGEPGQPTRRRYALATFMLAWNEGRSRFEYHTSDSSESWGGSDYDDAMRLGAPLGAYERLASGLYRRAFQGGLVLVDPRPSGSPAVELSLGGTYSGSSLSRVTHVTLTPRAGYILLRQ